MRDQFVAPLGTLWRKTLVAPLTTALIVVWMIYIFNVRSGCDVLWCVVQKLKKKVEEMIRRSAFSTQFHVNRQRETGQEFGTSRHGAF